MIMSPMITILMITKIFNGKKKEAVDSVLRHKKKKVKNAIIKKLIEKNKINF